jgi:chemotaxis phosphatase CheX-like protein
MSNLEELYEDRMLEILATSLERIAFVVTDPLDLPPDHDPDRHASISFDSEGLCGDIYLSADDIFLGELASNLLGVDEDEVSDEERHQALTELANIVGGEIIVALGAAEDDFRLGLPQRVEGLPSETSEMRRASVESDSGLLHVRVDPR